ncbi:metalloprotease [Pluteus cervinus]|uniref:Metalloprotease n=1 Tax=Pluteus cervinus TaxID=181527 RepID=A0ACD3B988_9AGAR|nr:metalloprotease [Pluteus cervinus]
MFNQLLALALAASLALGDPIKKFDICGTRISPEEKVAAEARFQANAVASLTSKATINVYWHVIYAGDALEQGNITGSQIADQIAVLNHDYKSTGLSFKLVNTSRTFNPDWFDAASPDTGEERDMKTALRVGGASDINVYSVGFTYAYGLLGYSVFPDWYESDPIEDGLVILYSSLPGGSTPDYNGGQTFTHELGHWLGLYHTFEGGCYSPGDYVDDTPPEDSPTYGCPTSRDTCGDKIADPIRKVHITFYFTSLTVLILPDNYMDYGTDACMTEWTPGQIARIFSQIATYRGI